MKTSPAPFSRSFRVINIVLASLFLAGSALAEVKTPAIFGSNMVLQRDHANPVWGWADKGEKVTVSIAGKSHKTQADKDGNWRVTLQSLEATAKPLTLSIKGKNELKYENVLVGEVWLCSGQSNMGMNVNRADDADLEMMSAKHPNLRIISVPQVGTQEPQKDFNGQWEAVTPDNAGDFSAVGYFFGRQIHQVLDVPVGLIDNAWGGSACEAWIRRDLLDKTAVAKPYVEQWKKTEAEFDPTKAMAEYEVRMAKWKEKAKKLRAGKKGVPKPPRKPRNPLTGQHRPANLYNGVLKPIIGYGIKGAIWYQGESNSARAKAYRTVFPLMIQNWRDEWKQGDFSFYWVQLADFRAENPEPEDDSWPELREAQTLTLDKLPNTGEAVIIDVNMPVRTPIILARSDKRPDQPQMMPGAISIMQRESAVGRNPLPLPMRSGTSPSILQTPTDNLLPSSPHQHPSVMLNQRDDLKVSSDLVYVCVFSYNQVGSDT